MEKQKLYAVLTGDLIGYSKFTVQRDLILSTLKDSFRKVDEIISHEAIVSPFEIFRGDSFQGVISKPEEALSAGIVLRASLLSGFKRKKQRLDARIAIGIGTIDFLPEGRGVEGDGEAFRNSGLLLDKMKKREHKIMVKTPWLEVNKELHAECALLDAIIDRWTNEQSQAIIGQIHGWTQEEIANKLNITQSAVFQRLKTAGAWAVQEFIDRYKQIIKENIRSETNNFKK